VSERKKILVVEDDREISNATCLRLRAAGFTALALYEGGDVVRQAENGRPEVILLDVRLPDVDGLTTLRELKRREETRRIPVVMLSASMRDEQAALDSGARYFLRKPYDGDNLLMAVRTAIDEVTDAVPPQGDCGATRLPAVLQLPSPHGEGQPVSGH
jgi:DNA-binding response OmpR family regulator